MRRVPRRQLPKPVRDQSGVRIYCVDVLEGLRGLPDESVHCVVTSPPYWGLRDYGVDGQVGLEKTPEEYVERMVGIFREVRRVLRGDGTFWLNVGDSYASGGRGAGGVKQQTNTASDMPPQKAPAGLKPKDLAKDRAVMLTRKLGSGIRRKRTLTHCLYLGQGGCIAIG